MKRRKFLQTSAMLAVAVSVAPSAMANVKKDKENKKDKTNLSLIDTFPVLQNYAETSQGIAFGVSALANGFVIYGRMPDLSDGRKVYCGGYRFTDVNDKVMLVRLTGLEPDTTYYYRIGADRIHYGGGYDMKVENTVEDSKVYSFRTAGKDADAHFCVINDTHAHWDAINLEMAKIKTLQPACVIWNGDACNSDEDAGKLKDIFFNRPTRYPDFATSIPYCFSMGNHEGRGFEGRHLERFWMKRQPEERLSRDWDLGRNFAVRMGEIALVGLDTGEDKVDTNPKFANLYLCKPYREAQTQWLRTALLRPDIASAPYLVVICHIPIYDDDPTSNPGDVYPADTDPQYSTDYAHWQRTCYQLWNPLLEDAHCQLVITAHRHHYRYDKPNVDHSWTQVVGGGPVTEKDTDEWPTVIDGRVEGGHLVLRTYNVLAGTLLDELTFQPR